jgi:hypothetical protein
MDFRKLGFCFLIDVWINSKLYLKVSGFISKYLKNLSSSLIKSSRRLWSSPKLSRLELILCTQKRLFLVNKRLLHKEVEEHNSTSKRARDFEKSDVDKTLSNVELNAGELFPRTAGCILAIQDQFHSTRSFEGPEYKQSEIINHWYDLFDIRTTWITTIILVLTYDQILSYHPHSGQGQLSFDSHGVRNLQYEPR